MLMPMPPGESGKLNDSKPGGGTKSLWRMLQFLDVADHPMSTQQLCKELGLRPENFPRYIRLFIRMGIAKEVHKIPVPGKRRAWYKAYQRTVKLAEVDEANE